MDGLTVDISFALAFAAGVVSFLSPCVLPVVPSYVSFVSGVTLEELRAGSTTSARRQAALHAVAFGVGFGLVFMTLGAAATAAGQAFARALPWLSRIGGLMIVLFGLWLAGPLRRVPGLAALQRDMRVSPSSKPAAGMAGSLAVGVAFGAGWTPCIGPVLASILLYAGLERTVLEGMLLLATYGLGLGLPFVGAAVAFNWFLAGSAWIRRWLGAVERVAGIVLVAVGLLMMTGYFLMLSSFLADMGQLIQLEAR